MLTCLQKKEDNLWFFCGVRISHSLALWVKFWRLLVAFSLLSLFALTYDLVGFTSTCSTSSLAPVMTRKYDSRLVIEVFTSLEVCSCDDTKYDWRGHFQCCFLPRDLNSVSTIRNFRNSRFECCVFSLFIWHSKKVDVGIREWNNNPTTQKKRKKKEEIW